jgi:hypothetical protein
MVKGLRKLIFVFFLLIECKNADNQSIMLNSGASKISQPQNGKSNIATHTRQAEKNEISKEIPQKIVSKVKIKDEPQIRLGVGVSDAKLNGEQILLQEELAENILLSNPDTIKNYLKSVNMRMEQNFPRSIEDNFTQGVSKEHIYYPQLNYGVELFSNPYSK